MSEGVFEIRTEWNIPYVYSAGKIATRFFKELRDNKRIMGTKCPVCQRVFVPPRKFCEDDFVEMDKWVEVSNEGIVESFTITYQRFMGLPNPPYAIALIKLDGADTAMAHMLGEVNLADIKKVGYHVKVGMRVKAVFKNRRVGNILDIRYFKPIR